MDKFTIPNLYDIDEITYTPITSAFCAVGKAPFQVQVQISYVPNDKLLEFEAFEDWLMEISTTETTIEGLTQMIADKLIAVLGRETPIRVYVQATTQVHAPVNVTIINEGG